MAYINLPNNITTGNLRDGEDYSKGSYVYANDKAIVDEINGNLDNVNIKTGANIAVAKISGTAVNLASEQTLENKTLDNCFIGKNTPYLGNFTTANANRINGVPQICTRTFVLPEYIQSESATIVIFPIRTEFAPDGIQITKCGINLDANRAYSVTFRYRTGPTGGDTTMATVATGSGEATKDSGTLTENLSVGQYIAIGLPSTTGAKWLNVWFTYTVRAS